MRDMVLTGKTPQEIFEIDGLIVVGFGKNRLTGTITSTIGYPWSTLQVKGVEENLISGTIPYYI